MDLTGLDRVAVDLDHDAFAIDPEPFDLRGDGHRWLQMTTDGARALVQTLNIEIELQERGWYRDA